MKKDFLLKKLFIVNSMVNEYCQYAQMLWTEFNIKTMKIYNNLCNQSDVLLLSDIFENLEAVAWNIIRRIHSVISPRQVVLGIQNWKGLRLNSHYLAISTYCWSLKVESKEQSCQYGTTAWKPTTNTWEQILIDPWNQNLSSHVREGLHRDYITDCTAHSMLT